MNNYQSDPVIEHIRGTTYGAAYAKEYQSIYETIFATKLTDKEFFKKHLGKQNRCEMLTNRNWIWETAIWRLYVEKRGFNFEVLYTLSAEEAWEAWQEFYKKLGITSAVKHIPVKKILAEKDIYYESFTYAELQQWIDGHLPPEGICPEKIELDFKIESYSAPYYDELHIEAKMILSIWE